MSEQNFENALEELEGIVEKLEKGGLPLNKSLSLFEKGVKLAKYLRTELEKEGKVKEETFNLKKTDSEEEENPESEEDDNLPF
jgi:exodeoxyribonuclease VII small subunit